MLLTVMPMSTVKDICGEELAAEVSRVAVELYSTLAVPLRL